MYQLVILEDAERELREAAEWYEQRSTGLGLRFIEVISRKLQVIHENPERSPKKIGNFRESVVKIFPFVIVYTLYKQEGIVTINSIFHTSRDSKRKFRRKRK